MTRQYRRVVADDSTFHLDKRVPLATIGVLALQTAAIIWWASEVNSTLSSHAQQLASIQTLGSQPMRERMLSVETVTRQLQINQETLQRNQEMLKDGQSEMKNNQVEVKGAVAQIKVDVATMLKKLDELTEPRTRGSRDN